MIKAVYVCDSEDKWSENIAAHVAYLEENVHIVLAAGGLLDDESDRTHGALYVIDVDSRDQARAFIEADPFAKAGMFAELVISRWRKSFYNFEHVGGPGFVFPGTAHS